MQLARAVRNRTTGVLYVLDEPSIGLHPSNIEGLLAVMKDLVADGNSVVFVDHDVQILSAADHLIEMGPGAGAAGGRLIAQGSVKNLSRDPASFIGPFLAGKSVCVRTPVSESDVFSLGTIDLKTKPIHTVKPLHVRIPKGRLTVVTGVSGSGKTTLVLESLVPALSSLVSKRALPEHVTSIEAPGISAVKLIDASPIGINVRSTVATYANVHDELRKVFAKTQDAKDQGFKAGDFPTTPANCVVRPATAREKSIWTFNSCPTSTSTVPIAAEAATECSRTVWSSKIKTENLIRCRS